MSDKQQEYRFETRQIHAGSFVDSDFSARITPIYQTAAYVFDDFEQAKDRFGGERSKDLYSRPGNPTNAVVERRLADLENGVEALLTSSGQGAISAVLLGLTVAGDNFIATSSLYEGTKGLFRNTLARHGVSVRFISAEATSEQWAEVIDERTRAIFTETIPNPKNDIVDLEHLVAIAHKFNIPLITDNTVATPYLIQPANYGADIIVHSTSKWLSGHGQLIGGAIIDAGSFDWNSAADKYPQITQAPHPDKPSFTEKYGSRAFLRYLRESVVYDHGFVFPATSAFLLLQGIETLSIRMERHVENAQKVAEYLENHPLVDYVDYPGLASNSFYERGLKFFPHGVGSIVTFEIRGEVPAAKKFFDSLKLISRMTHIGDLRTLALHTGSTIHGQLTEEQRLEIGITPGLIRLSIGLEHVDDIVQDLNQALEATR